MRRLGTFRIWAGLAAAALLAGFWGASEINATRPARSVVYQSWLDRAPKGADAGAALLAFADFGALDLDTLETAAVPWPFIATALALREANGNPDRVEMAAVRTALARFGFLFPRSILGNADLRPSDTLPLGLSIGVIERTFPPLRMTAMNIGCAACHAGVAYRSDGLPDASIAVLGRPNSALDIEAFTVESYIAVKRALADEPRFLQAMGRLFQVMSLRERTTIRWIGLPRLKRRMSELSASIDRPLPFMNGAPGLTNGVAALKFQLGLLPRTQFSDSTGFVSIPDLADRNFRSAVLADGAYAPKGESRFHPITRAEAASRDPRTLAAIASFFMVPSMGLTSERAEAAIADLTAVVSHLARTRAPSFPGSIDAKRAALGRLVYARACASCHGTYDDDAATPRLLVFPNWAGSVGTDMSRVKAFNARLSAAVMKTPHGQRHLDAATTGVVAAPLLSGVWASAPYFVNGSVPTLLHLLEPETRPIRFMTGAHRLDLERVGIAGVLTPTGTWEYPPLYAPYATPALIDTTRPGFSNRGHEAEVQGLTAEERRGLLEYLKLL